jgi:hypothetical protein
MAAPFAMQAVQTASADHTHHTATVMASVMPVDWPTLWATSVHTAGYLLVTALLAVLVYERAAIHVVRRAWINFDLVWAGALILTGVAIVVV